MLINSFGPSRIQVEWMVSKLPHTTEALRIIDRVEKEIVRSEFLFGRERLLRTVLEFGSEAYHSHIEYYRRVIRETIWPHGVWVAGTHADFLRGFELSALGYVWTGFEALEFFTGSRKWDIFEIYEDALIAESLRGQFGKSSPDGLDRRLELLEDQFLHEHGTERDLIELCTPVAPIRTAETCFIGDFHEVSQIFPSPPTIEDVVSLEEAHRETAWRFLRRHARWHVATLDHLYSSMRSCKASTADKSRPELEAENQVKSLSSLDPNTLNLVDKIMSLNVLNLVFEPAYSFKGCVGLPLGMVFRMAQHVERRPPLDQIKLLIGKMNLFNLAEYRSRNA